MVYLLKSNTIFIVLLVGIFLTMGMPDEKANLQNEERKTGVSLRYEGNRLRYNLNKWLKHLD